MLQKDKILISNNLNIIDNNLTFGGACVSNLAEKYGTPLYVMDENSIRNRCKEYVLALKEVLGENAMVLYASKACSFKKIYEIISEEGMGADVVSIGEIYTCLKAGFPLKNAFFHSNNKTDYDIEFAIDNGIGYFVADNEEELYAIEKIASKKGVKQNVLLRLTPGIDPHTFDAVSTGQVDSKFGSPIETGKAEEVTKIALSLNNVNLCGFHCHVGSQVFDTSVYNETIDIMLNYVKMLKIKYNFDTKVLDLGGGFGVRYDYTDPELKIYENVKKLATYVKNSCKKLEIALPFICLEPGRSIVADSGITVYTVGTIKKIDGYKNYVSVDGGMTDNPRFALYNAKYTVVPTNLSKNLDMTCSVVGRCCESGDIIQENVNLPSDIKRGDLIAVLTTGAYNYSMASNYNRICRPPVIMLKNGEPYVAVKRETLDDIIKNDI